jgi:hypothetical protein
MKLKYYIRLLSTLFAIILFIHSCKKDLVNPDVINSVSFDISHNVDGNALQLDNISYVNANNDVFSVINLRYFISNIYLHRGNDSTLLKDYHYVDIRDVSTLSFTSKQQIINGTYDYISLIIGLNETQNVNGYFVNPPEVNMAWPTPMGGGYHYMQLEGKFDSAGTVKNYNLHTGKLMGAHRYIHMKLSSSYLIATGDDLNVTLTMNINEWLKNPTIYDFNIYGESIMGNATAQTIAQQNGADVFSISVKK